MYWEGAGRKILIPDLGRVEFITPRNMQVEITSTLSKSSMHSFLLSTMLAEPLSGDSKIICHRAHSLKGKTHCWEYNTQDGQLWDIEQGT